VSCHRGDDFASEGTVTQQLLEATPGLVVSQHSGEGKANQFYLCGFNLDHGTDLRTTVGGMLVNQRTHAHGQGWTDLNFLI
jgi:outer membrane cobalamin receptor